MTESNNKNGVDKESLYGDFNSFARKRDKLFLRGAHKALDIPEDDMQITSNSNNENHYHPKPSIGNLAKAAIAASLLSTGVGAGIGIPLAIDALKNKPTIEQKAPEPAVQTKTITIDFEIKDGKLITSENR